MRLRITLLLIVFAGFSLSLASQQAFFKTYTVYDGLVANPVRCVYQDSKGFIWIGTFEGLSRYDGYKFTNYTTVNGLSHNLINSIIEADGKLLIGENNGAVDVIENNSLRKGYKLASAVNLISPYKNRLLLSTDAMGFYEYKNDSIIHPRQDMTGMPLGNFIEFNDSLLISGLEHHLSIYKNDLTIHSKVNSEGLLTYFLFQDSRKRVWVCSNAGLKLLELPPKNNQFSTFAPPPTSFNFSPLNNSQVTSMIEEKDGSFWIGTMKGLVRIFPGGNYQIYNENDGLPSAIIYTMYRDRENNLWIGTAMGLAKWVSKNNVVFLNIESKEFKNDVTSIHILDNKKLILNTYHGLQQFYFDTKEFKDIRSPSHGYYIPISHTTPLLVHYADKLGILDEKKNFIALTEKLDSPIMTVRFACQHPAGNIYFGSDNGLYVSKKSAVRKILKHRITSLLIDKKGHVWAGTWNNGLFRIIQTHSADSTVYNIQDFTSLISHVQIRSLFEDNQKNIWVGTRYGGAFCLKEGVDGKFETQHFDRQSGLMSDWVWSFAELTNGDLWIGTFLGLDRLVKEGESFRIFNFSKATNFFAQIGYIIPVADDYWMCVAHNGIAYFKDEDVHKTPPMGASLLSVSLGVHENKITIISPQKKISLKPNQNAARFEFSALSFVNERQIMYSYRLKGSSDTTWSKPENIHEASYASLSPGSYTFEVKTIGWNGPDSAPAAFAFFISTPFWRQGWFIGMMILAVTVFFYSLYLYRIRQLLRLQRVRNRIATDLHDDIGSSLTNISILSELSSKNLSQPEKAQPFLLRISEEVQASSQAMDDIIWSVNSRNDSLQETMARMRRYAAELFDNTDIKCHLQLDEPSAYKKLSMELRRDVYLIYKEALNNIHKHAHAKNVWIEVIERQNYLFMRISDDGRGFNTSLNTHRNGLKNLRARVDKWKGNIHIQSGQNGGTEIEVKLTLKE